MQNEIRKRTRTYAVVAVLLAALLGVLCYNFGVIQQTSIFTGTSVFKTFSSEADLKTFLTNSQNSAVANVLSERSSEALPAFALSVSGNTPAYSTPAYSTTNVQVAGVDEADTVKTDGQYLYKMTGSNIYILKAYPPQDAQLVSTITLDSMSPAGIYATSDRLVVLGNYGASMIQAYYGAYYENTMAFAKVYDVSNKSDIGLLRTYAMNGSYVKDTSRMIGKYVYFVINELAYIINDTVILPQVYSGNETKTIPATEIYYSGIPDSYLSYTTFVALNVQDTGEEPTQMTVTMGATSAMYVSLKNIYVTFPETSGETSIYRVSLDGNNLTCEAKGNVPGRILDQFSMDEYDGYFRVVTTDQTSGIVIWNLPIVGINATGGILRGPVSTPLVGGAQRTNLYVLNLNMSVLGKLENISVGENLHSARFVGDRCYLVTFQKTDPLFVIGLSDPTNPIILGELNVTGYSDYLQPYDETHIIGVGKETTVAEQGWFAWYQGVKISIFDVSNVSNPVQLAKYVIGDRGTDSPVLQDHKALLFDRTRNLLVIPVKVAEIDPKQYPEGVPPGAYGTPVWQGAYVFNATLTDGLVLRGKVTHIEDGYIWNSGLEITRSLYIENVLYTVSDKKIKMNSLDDMTQLKEINLP